MVQEAAQIAKVTREIVAETAVILRILTVKGVL